MDEEIRKQMSSTNKKCITMTNPEKIFNVRKLHYKQYEGHDKCIFAYDQIQILNHNFHPSKLKIISMNHQPVRL